MAELKIKRAYDAPNPSDGKRVLVDALWPRGIRKTELKLDDWWKDLAPSTELRKWYGHDPDKWTEFRKRFAAELNEKPDAVQRLRKMAGEGTVTLVYSSREEKLNNAVALKELVEGGKV